MKWTPSLFGLDEVRLSLWDVAKLLIGRRVSDGGCVVSIGRPQAPVKPRTRREIIGADANTKWGTTRDYWNQR
jgi:hypothetical protein